MPYACICKYCCLFALHKCVYISSFWNNVRNSHKGMMFMSSFVCHCYALLLMLPLKEFCHHCTFTGNYCLSSWWFSFLLRMKQVKMYRVAVAIYLASGCCYWTVLLADWYFVEGLLKLHAVGWRMWKRCMWGTRSSTRGIGEPSGTIIQSTVHRRYRLGRSTPGIRLGFPSLN